MQTIHPSRRRFIQASTVAAAAAATLVVPPAVHAADSARIKVGIVGCGGRGSGAMIQALNADKGAVLHAAGDLFPDRLNSALESFSKQKPEQVKFEDRRFTGFDAYEKVINSGVDVVILTAPPGFRPLHLRAAVEAGKHVFCEKPMAVDAPGVRSVMESVRIAERKRLNVVAGFCWRYNFAERETFKRLHDGAVGEVLAMHNFYNASGLWVKPRQPAWSDAEWQLRNWLYFTWLSGDHVVEQAVHTIDKMMWAMRDVPPLRATGQGGRQARTDAAYGHVWDHFSVVFEWPGGVKGHFQCRQQDGTQTGVRDQFVGTTGSCDVTSGSSHVIKGTNKWRYEGEPNNMYQTEHDELFAAIRAGQVINDGVRMCTSTMAAILGRMAAYTGQPVTWEQAMASKEDLTPANLGFGPMPTPPVAVPGKTKFI